MPYVDKFNRNVLERRAPRNAGELNYVITRLVIEYLGDHPNYERYNAVVGALESCKLEFYRRAVSAYEDIKIIQNGDVYGIPDDPTS